MISMDRVKLLADIDKAIEEVQGLRIRSSIQVKTEIALPGIKNEWAQEEYFALFKEVYKRVDEKKVGGVEAALCATGVFVRKVGI